MAPSLEEGPSLTVAAWVEVMVFQNSPRPRVRTAQLVLLEQDMESSPGMGPRGGWLTAAGCDVRTQ
jgi:hypothetical protein